MAKADPAACKLCARLTKKAGETTKCKWHGGAGHPKSGGSKKATGGGKGESKKSKPPKTRAVRNTTAVAFGARVDSMLTAAKVRVTQLRADLASEEKKVEILTELVGA